MHRKSICQSARPLMRKSTQSRIANSYRDGHIGISTLVASCLRIFRSLAIFCSENIDSDYFFFHFATSTLASSLRSSHFEDCHCIPLKMSPTDAKRGAKRRKNKRGGGSSSCTSSICSIASNIQAGSPTTAPTCLPRVPAAPVTGFLTSGGTGNGDVGGLASLKGEVRPKKIRA